MSKILKQTLKSLFFTSFLLLSSCSIEEDLIKDENNKQKLKITNIKFEELIQRKDFNDALSKIKTKKETNSEMRTVMEDQYGFTISDFPAKVIEYDNNTTSFTLSIFRDNILNNNDFENLVIEIDSINNVTAKIVKYKPFLPVNIISSNNIEFHGNVELSSITYNSNQSNPNSKMVYDCVTIASSKCTGVPYDCGGDVCGFKYTNYCGYYDDGDYGGGGGTGGSGTGGGTGGGTSTSTVYQDPNVAKLNSLTNNTVVKPKMLQLQTKMYENIEYGYDFQTNSSNNIIASPLLSGSSTQPEINFGPALANTKLRVHVHYVGASTYAPDGLSPIPSSGDIFKFAIDHKAKKDMGSINSQELVSISMGRNGNYALVITDPAKFINFCNEINNPQIKLANGKFWIQHVNQYFNLIEKKATTFCPTCNTQEIDALLHNLFVRGVNNMLDIGIKVYHSEFITTGNYSWSLAQEITRID